jgi:putative molybdopterin biosynthesis protein
MRDDNNRLRFARMRKGMSQAELARDAEVSRQSLSALEGGKYQPSVQFAIRLARALGESVESLFGESGLKTIKASLAPAKDFSDGIGTRVTLGRVGGRLVAVPQEVASLSLVPVGGLISGARRSGQVEVSSFRSEKEIGATLLIAGCDPSIPVVADWFARKAKHVTLVSSLQTSYGAIDCFIRGQTHACGVHLCDRTGEFNLALIKRRLGNRPARIVNFAKWEVGLAVKPDDRFAIRSVADLGNKGVRIVNRQPGSGARIVLDEMLKECGLDGQKILGYENEARGHLEVAAAVAGGSVDAGITLRVAGEAFGLRFFAIRTEQYGLIIPEREFDTEPVKVLLDALNSSALATEVGSLCFYDTRAMGEALARLD